MKLLWGEYVLVLRPKPPKKKGRVRSFFKRFILRRKRPTPTLFHKCLAVHIKTTGTLTKLE